MNVIAKAYQQAVKLVTSLTSDNSIEEERAELSKLSKKELIELILKERHSSAKTASIMDIAYALLCDKDCVWLGYGQLATIIREQVPGAKTQDSNLRWYFSKQAEYGYDCLPRKPIKEIAAELVKG